MKLIKNIYLFLLLTALLFACQDDEMAEAPVMPDEQAIELGLKHFVQDTMNAWYLWNEDLPSVNVDDFASADELLDALRNPLDKWSYIEKADDYDAYFNKGQYEGYGFRMAVDAENQLRVAFAYKDSPFFREGIDRSWTISKINGKSVQSLIADTTLNKAFDNATNTFELVDTAGHAITKSISKSTVGINSVLYRNVYQAGDSKVGYLVFNNFLQTSFPELREAFRDFQQQGIRDLVLDLRYNGGGRVNVASYIASNIVGNRGNGRNFVEFVYNKDKSTQNEYAKFPTPDYPLNLDRLFVITSDNTASSSELVINGLKPFMDVILIGDDTYGKPVGSFPFQYEGYSFSPISFKTANDNGEGEYFDGLPANAYIEDDLNHAFGNPQESRLKEALYYIKNGAFSGQIARTRPSTQKSAIRLEGFRQEIGAF